MSFFWWGALPYICFTLLVAGLIWRWRWDQYGWTSRSSQLNEGRLLRWASPLFHFGVLAVAGGHLMGLAFPKSFTRTVGITDEAYHLVATIGGGLAGVTTGVGLLALLYRRFVYKSVRLATTKNDLLVYLFLVLPIGLGICATFINQIFGGAHGYDYRESISPWFRSVFMLNPQVDLMANVPLSFQMHIVAGMLLFALWPFTRLVHVVSVPLGYLARPEIIYRSREGATSTAAPIRGWTPVRNRGYQSVTNNLNNGELVGSSTVREVPAQGA